MNKQKYWEKINLTEEEIKILRDKVTEIPFTGEYLDNKKEGIYSCKVCKTPLFSSEEKFDSGSGWPSFYDVIEKGNIELVEDNSHGMHRTEVVCATCGAHLGHVFKDGPSDKTGLRYCINSVCLNFNKK